MYTRARAPPPPHTHIVHVATVMLHAVLVLKKGMDTILAVYRHAYTSPLTLFRFQSMAQYHVLPVDMIITKHIVRVMSF